jgi:hypothetical protein
VLLQALLADDGDPGRAGVGGRRHRPAHRGGRGRGGAAGVLLDTQLRCCPRPTCRRRREPAARMDGTETVSEGGRRGLRHGEPNLLADRPGRLARPEFAGRWADTAAAVRGIRRPSWTR